MMRILFFLSSYPIRYRMSLIGLLCMERFISQKTARKWFRDFIVESRSILGYLHDRGGSVKQAEGGIEVSWIEGSAQMRVFLRWNSSDFLVFEQVIIKEEYAAACDFIRDQETPRFIIDAGANIGCSSLYFKRNFPNSTIIAIEPEESNRASLRKNIEANNLRDIQIFPVALWYKETLLSFQKFGDGRDWSHKVTEGEEGNIHAKTLSQILEAAGVSHIDILKIDIEGAESEIFKKDQQIVEVLSKVKVLAIETHTEEDDVMISAFLSKLGFDIMRKRETLFAFSRGRENTQVDQSAAKESVKVGNDGETR